MSENNPKPYSIRIPSKLRQELEKNAKNNGRSLHSEILLRLEQSLSNNPDLLATNDLNLPNNKKLLKELIREVIKEED